jgi:hypothetical protein
MTQIWQHIQSIETKGKPASEIKIPFTRMSVYYHWSTVSRGIWKLHDVPLQSAREFMREQGRHHHVRELDVEPEPGTEVLAFECTDIMDKCASKTRELGIDSTCMLYSLLSLSKLTRNTGNTNRGNFELFGAVSAQNGFSVPLAFCLVSTKGAKASHGAKEKIIGRWLDRLKERGVNPEFTLSDKDWSEINALKKTWPKAKHILCLWHVLRAVKQRLAKNRTQPAPYDANAAHERFDFIDPLFVPEQQLEDPTEVSITTATTCACAESFIQPEPPPETPLRRIFIVKDGRPQILTPAVARIRIPAGMATREVLRIKIPARATAREVVADKAGMGRAPSEHAEASAVAGLDATAAFGVGSCAGVEATPASQHPAWDTMPGPDEEMAAVRAYVAEELGDDGGDLELHDQAWSDIDSDVDEEDERWELRDLDAAGVADDDESDADAASGAEEEEEEMSDGDEADPDALADEQDLDEESTTQEDEPDEPDGDDVPVRRSARSKARPSYTFCPLPHRAPILRLVTKHAAMHPLLPERHGRPRSSIEIYNDAVVEMYFHCWRNRLREVWAYLWCSWYRPGRWELWTRSSKPGSLSTRRTTMMVEAMWRNFKRLVLHMYNRPPVDLATYAIVTKALPPYRVKLATHLGNTREGRAALPTHEQAAFKRAFDRLRKATINNSHYSTNVATWTCDCGSQKYHAQLMCKHLVQAAGAPPAAWWVSVKRYYVPPFYTVPQADGSISLPAIDRNWPEARPEGHGVRSDEEAVTDDEDDLLPSLARVRHLFSCRVALHVLIFI